MLLYSTSLTTDNKYEKLKLRDIPENYGIESSKFIWKNRENDKMLNVFLLDLSVCYNHNAQIV